MTDATNKQLASQPLPSFLQSREGWSRMLEMKRTAEPHLHQIEPTNACPYTCIMCPRAEKMTRPVGFMNMDLFVKVIDEVRTYSPAILRKEVELFHFGESLLHPRIVEMTDYAGKAGLNTVLSVNAPEFTPEKAGALFEACAGKIIISLDGFDKASYVRLRGSHADYDKAVRNIIEASLLHTRMKARTRLAVRMIVIEVNADQAERFKADWKSHGIDVELRQFFPWGEKEMVHLGQFDRYPPFMPCPFSWQYVVIQWNGDVVACCRDYNGVNVMGNIQETSLKEIWNGPVYEHFRQAMANGTYTNPICSPCMDIYYNNGIQSEA